ncbi:MAG: DUF1294 domain-containing protein [Lachnospiraceae bacterium]
MIKFIMYYLFGINLISLAAYGIDKRKAIKGRWRVPESTLITLAVIGGSVGALAGMKLFHHKTKKKKFSIGVPAILVIQILAGCAVYFWIK